jgi:hypothetical protein
VSRDHALELFLIEKDNLSQFFLNNYSIRPIINNMVRDMTLNPRSGAFVNNIYEQPVVVAIHCSYFLIMHTPFLPHSDVFL